MNRRAPGMGSRGAEDFKLPAVSNKQAMGGLKNMPGMPSSKGLDSRGNRGSQGGNKPPRLGNNFKSNLGAGYNK